jgi:hypothetical protein
MSSSKTTGVFINNEKAQDEASDIIASPWCWRHKAIACLSDFDYHNISEPIIPWSIFHLWLSKIFDAFSVVSLISSIISFWSYQLLPSDRKLLIPSFPESRDEIPCTGGASFITYCDEDINTLATIIPSVEILDPITWSRAQQLNHQVILFLCSSAYIIESQLLPNDLNVLRNLGEDHGGQIEHQEGAGEPRRCAQEGGEPIQFRIAEFESNSESRTTSYSNWRQDCIRPPF